MLDDMALSRLLACSYSCDQAAHNCTKCYLCNICLILRRHLFFSLAGIWYGQVSAQCAQCTIAGCCTNQNVGDVASWFVESHLKYPKNH